MAAHPKRDHREPSGVQREVSAVVSTKHVFKLLLTLCALTVAAVVFAPVSLASTSCPARSVSQPFAGFGDSNNYFIAPGGTFEGGAPGWSLPGASLVLGNETRYLHSTADTTSLRITGSATSAPFCITQSDPMARFVAKTTTTAGSTGNYSQLNVYALVRNSAGSAATYYLGALPASKY